MMLESMAKIIITRRKKMVDRLRVHRRAGDAKHPVLIMVALMGVLAGMLALPLVGPMGYVRAATTVAPVASSGITPPNFADLAEDLGPSVVNIKVTKVEKAQGPGGSPLQEGPFGDMFRHFYGDNPRSPDKFKSRGAGSGVIVNADGTILTNNHVIEGASEILVTMQDKREFKAKVLGRDPKTDLAVVKIEKVEGKGQLRPAALGDSDKLRVGEWVLAIGNPFGFSSTVTAGIVSAKGRFIGAGPYDDFIQTDAPINPGNSGGPLFNMRGEVVGINAAIFSPSGASVGIGFAVPVNTAKTLLPELISKGKVTRGYLGINIQDVTDDLASSLGLKSTKGALVSEVLEDSPAQKAGFKRGDVVTTFNGKEIENSRELASVVAATPVGKSVTVKVLREGKEMSLQVQTGDLSTHDSEKEDGEETASKGKWGLQLRDVDPMLAQQMGLKMEKGVVVTAVQQGSPAEESGVRPGDVILEVNREPVKTVEEAQRKMDKSPAKGSVLLLLQRGTGTRYVALKEEAPQQ
jgi:serine protease Do